MTAKATIQRPKGTKHLEQLQAMIRGDLPMPAVAKLVGFQIVGIEVGRSVFALEVGPQHFNPMGSLHGGILCDVVDAALGTAMQSSLEDDETYTSLDLNVKFLKPVWKGRLTATAELVKRSRSIGLGECEVVDETGSLVARAYSSCMVLRGEAAKGR
jgi:uncharacterized protein (TIGR00369 family)